MVHLENGDKGGNDGKVDWGFMGGLKCQVNTFTINQAYKNESQQLIEHGSDIIGPVL